MPLKLSKEIQSLLRYFYLSKIELPILVKDWIRMKEDTPEQCIEKEKMYFALHDLKRQIFKRLNITGQDCEELLIKLEYHTKFGDMIPFKKLLQNYQKLHKIYGLKRIRY